MATIPNTAESAFQQVAFPPMPVSRLPVAGYEEWIRAGIITEDDQIELLDGWIVPKMTQNPHHILAAELARDILDVNVPSGWCVYCERPIGLAASMPQPDVTIVRGAKRQFRDRRIQADDVGLVIEVADASLATDRGIKKTIYAQAGISCYWLINLIEQRIEVYSDPTGSGETADYSQRRDYLPADEIPLVLDGQHFASLPVRDLLP